MSSSKLCFSCALPGSVAKVKDRLLQRPTPAHNAQAAVGGESTVPLCLLTSH